MPITNSSAITSVGTKKTWGNYNVVCTSLRGKQKNSRLDAIDFLQEA